MTIQNLPKFIGYNDYIVARWVDGEYWYWGTYRTALDADRAAAAIDGDVFTPDEIAENRRF